MSTRAPRIVAHATKSSVGPQRKASGPAQSLAPPIVHDVLGAPGQPIEPATRTLLETRFAHDFSRVRIHTDQRAADSARVVGAHAYTVGSHIVFGSGRYQPGTSDGRRLALHEGMHVVQQRAGGASLPSHLPISSPSDQAEQEAAATETAGRAHSTRSPLTLQRDVAAFFTSLFNLSFTEAELQEYLQNWADKGRIEGDDDSDDKAEQIVSEWKLGGSPYVLTMMRKAVLIREMLDGPTTAQDEDAIVEILFRSRNPEIEYMFGTGGVSATQIVSDVPDGGDSDLALFCRDRVKGGIAQFRKGSVEPTGESIQLGITRPKPRREAIFLKPLEGADFRWNVPCVLGILCSQDRGKVAQLPNLTVKRLDRIDVTKWSYQGNQWSSEIVNPQGLAHPKTKLVGILRKETCDSVAQTLVHEIRHLSQNPKKLTTQFQRERGAYIYSEKWAIRRGLRKQGDFRATDPDTKGKEVPDIERIEEHVKKRYGREESPATGVASEVVGHKSPSTTILEGADGSKTERPAEEGDRYLVEPPKLINEEAVPNKEWKCPGS